MIKRLDALVHDIRTKYHTPEAAANKDENAIIDVAVVGHGHILRAFAMRWVGKPLTDTSLIMEAGGVGTLR